MAKLLRFTFPIAFAISGYALATLVVTFLARRIDEVIVTYDMIEAIPGYIATDTTAILGLSSIAGIIVYLILGVPIATIIMIGIRIIRATAYDIDIAQIGNRFGGMRMVRRATVPAIFSVALSGIVMQVVEGFLFSVLSTVPPVIAGIYNFLGPLIGALVTMPVVLAIFVPTWLMNDAGIVMHLKSDQLEIRRCPDTIGVGRWVNNLLAGFTILTIPIISFAQHFLPLIDSGATLQSNFFDYFVAFIYSIGIPFIAMAFIIPVIVVNEILLGTMKKPIRGVAKRLGARELKIETVITETHIIDKDSEEEYGWGLKKTKK